MKAIGLILIVVGVLSLMYQGFTYTTHRRVLDVGPIQATKEEHHSVPLPPILGALALIGGVVVLVSDRRSS
jgi:drug/metabolite transporter (DMT)-like permease